jgi:hypothetical protein
MFAAQSVRGGVWMAVPPVASRAAEAGNCRREVAPPAGQGHHPAAGEPQAPAPCERKTF